MPALLGVVHPYLTNAFNVFGTRLPCPSGEIGWDLYIISHDGQETTCWIPDGNSRAIAITQAMIRPAEEVVWRALRSWETIGN